MLGPEVGSSLVIQGTTRTKYKWERLTGALCQALAAV